MYIRPERALKIGMIVVIIAVVIIGISIYGTISSEISTQNYRVSAEGNEDIQVNVTQGILLTYSVFINSNFTNNFRAWFTEPSGNVVLESNFTGSGISKSLVAPTGGQWVFHLENLGNNSSDIGIHLGQLSLLLEAGLYAGITALVVGFVFIGYFFSMQRRERIRRSRHP
jgi:hypothetical protein